MADITTVSPSQKYQFLSRGGEMGELIRTKDWVNTPVGSPDQWPQSLRTALSIILHAKFPMFLWWGEQLTCFYNDAYRPSLGNEGKHPGILGEPAEKAWAEIWHIIKPLIDQVLAGGEAPYFEDALIPIYRNGKIQDVYWTFSYSAINDESGKPAGVFVTCVETTEKVNTQRVLEIEEARLRLAIEGTQLSTWDLDLENNQVVHSQRFAEIFGHPLSATLTHQQMEAQLYPGDEAIVQKAFEKAMETGKYNYEARIIRPDNIITWIKIQGKVIFDNDSKAQRIIGTLKDITATKIAEEKLAMLAAIVESSEDAIISKQLNGIISSWNVGAQKIFGYTPDEIIGQHVTKLIPKDRYDEEPEILKRIHKGESVEHFETKRLTKNNELLDISLTISPIRDKEGNIIGASKIARNITGQKQTEKKVADSEQYFKTISNASPVGLWMTDINGENNFVNDTWIKWTGMPLEQHYKYGWLGHIMEEDKKTIPSFQHAFKRREKYTAEFRIRKQDEEIRWCLAEGSPFYNVNGDFAGYAGSVTDITDIKKLEQQKDFFISMASHELKTPITSIKGYVQILQGMHKDSPDTFLKNSLKTVNKQVGTLTKLITDLLDMSKIKSGGLQLNKEEFSLNEMIRETIEEIKHTQPGFDIMLSSQKENIVYADRLRIAQVLINFLTNAIKYSPHFNMVTVKTTVIEKNVIVSVIDSGIGISKNDQEKIFQRFYRVEGKDEKTFPGFGIGLFIAAEIIQRHEGKISVESEPGKGSIFSFSLPVED